MKNVLLLMTGMLLSISSYSQNVTYEAVKLAELLLNQSWEQQIKNMPVILTGFKSQIRQAGATEKASNIFADELAQAMNKDQFINIYAHVISLNLTQDETVQLDKFLRSDIGRKFLTLSNDVVLPVHLEPIKDRAYKNTCAKLDEIDRTSIRCR